jgi:hypothetical protein
MPKTLMKLVFIFCALAVGGVGCNRRSVSPQALYNSEATTAEPSNAKDKPSMAGTGESFSKWPSSAANVIRAEIISVDEENRQVTIKDIATGNQLTTKVGDPSTLGSFVPGDRVRVTFPSSDTMTAISVVAEENVKE